jgi:hypothetical protein
VPSARAFASETPPMSAVNPALPGFSAFREQARQLKVEAREEFRSNTQFPTVRPRRDSSPKRDQVSARRWDWRQKLLTKKGEARRGLRRTSPSCRRYCRSHEERRQGRQVSQIGRPAYLSPQRWLRQWPGPLCPPNPALQSLPAGATFRSGGKRRHGLWPTEFIRLSLGSSPGSRFTRTSGGCSRSPGT